MNFVAAFKQGQTGNSVSFPMGEGLASISRAIGGVRKGKLYVMGAAPKVGKSTVVDVGWVIEPCVYALDMNKKIDNKVEKLSKTIKESSNTAELKSLSSQVEKLQKSRPKLEVIYFSYEIDRVSKEFDFAAHFLYRDYGISFAMLPEGKTYKDKNYISLSSDYLMGELVYDTDSTLDREVIKVSAEIEDKLKKVYSDRIIPLFGEYNDKGERVSVGLISVIENRDNPTGIRNSLLSYAASRGTFKYSTAKTKEGKTVNRRIGYTPNDPNLLSLIVTDHIRKVLVERSFTLKQTVDKYAEYTVELRNLCKFSFVHIVHLNRGMSDVQRRKLDDDRIYPLSDDIKETGNLSEDSNYIFTMFNPNDDRYNLDKHFGKIIKSANGSLKYPNMRTLHLVESRHCEAPQHFRVDMLGGVKTFKQLKID